MNTSLKYVLAAAAVAIAAVVSGPVANTVFAQNEAATTTYKIGVVDMDKVLEGYIKLKAEADALEAERDKRQTELDTKTKALQVKMEGVKEAPEAERDRRREEIETELRNLRADMQRMQGELDSKGQKLSTRTREDIISAIQLVGAAENYHLILEGDADGRSTVIYFTNTINITSKVVAKLNGGPTAAAPKASASADTARKSN
ncbi:MAG: OmpH family outer membrane protein [Candidatus Hydrogenedentes bacterium]|nr:OmpH family outer membrane protein [Candidatus Hydrogenedentota bacterium]